MIPPQSWAWRQICGLYTGCFLGNLLPSWGSSTPRDSVLLYWSGWRESKEGQQVNQDLTGADVFMWLTMLLIFLSVHCGLVSATLPSSAQCIILRLQLQKAIVNFFKNNHILADTEACFRFYALCVGTHSLTFVTDMKPDNFRADISFSAVLTLCFSAPGTQKEASQTYCKTIRATT